jgi:FKBP-type peptidyl-prolyl cis-trans isomerases 1
MPCPVDVASRMHPSKVVYAIALSVAAASVGCAGVPSPRAVPGIIPPIAGTPRELGNIRVIDIVEGNGAPAASRKCVYTHYTGWLADGTKFDSSRDSTRTGVAAEPVAFVQGMKQVIDAWDTGFNGMRVGGSRRLFVPWRQGYGARGNPPAIPPRADLVFDVELMAVADTLPHRSGPVSCPDWRVVKSRGQDASPPTRLAVGSGAMLPKRDGA